MSNLRLIARPSAVDPKEIDGVYRGEASWGGHRFFDFDFEALTEEPVAEYREPRIFTHKYVPRTFGGDGEDAAYLTTFDSDDADDRSD